MLNFTDLVAQYPPPLRGFQRYILREYLQTKLLAIIFSSPIGSKLAFIGGTALCLIYHNSRFSEDIDFDNFDLTESDFTALSQSIQTKLQAEGYTVEIKNVHKGAYRCYIRFPHLLFKLGLTPIEEEKILIQLDSAAHYFDYQPKTHLLNKFDIFTPIRVTPLDILLSQKLLAAFSRRTPKGRDFYDIVFLLSLTKPNYAYLKAKLTIDTDVTLRQKLFNHIKSYDFTALAQEVRPFLFNPTDSQRVQYFPDYFKTVALK